MAQRSSEAVKDIESLISSSVKEVAHGSALVREAGQTLKEIVDASSRVTQTVEDISLAAAEQARGVAEVSESVVNMDRATQQNAELAEASARDANELTGRTGTLNDVVGRFKTNRVTSESQRQGARLTRLAG